MNNLLKEIGMLSEKLVLQLMSKNMSNTEAQDAVLVILKEYMKVGNTTNEDLRECIMGLKLLLNK